MFAAAFLRSKSRWMFGPTVAILFCGLVGTARGQDQVEFMTGSKLDGKVTAIRKEAKEFDFEAKLGGRSVTRTYPFATVHAVTFNGQRHVLTPRPAVESRPTGKPGSSTRSSATVERTRREIEELIELQGSSPPDWYDSTPLDHPPSLDLAWPLKPPTEGWHNQRNMGQFIWDIVNPNPRRWRSGIKLVHHCMTLHADDPARLQRDMQTLGMMYFQLLQDYPRAAYWLQKSAGGATPRERVTLAECYFHLGSKSLAMDMLRTPTLPMQAIKLFGDMGETEMAVKLAAAMSKTQQASEAFVMAGDALRQAGRSREAIAQYKRAIASDSHRNEEYAARTNARAQESIDAIEMFDQLDISQIADGAYRGVSTGYNGQMTIEAKVIGGQIESVNVVSHQEKQFYSALTDTPRRILEKQSVQEVDGVSAATITSQAIVNATARALAKRGDGS